MELQVLQGLAGLQEVAVLVGQTEQVDLLEQMDLQARVEPTDQVVLQVQMVVAVLRELAEQMEQAGLQV
jgi:citrate lyase gamma subunit